MSDAARAAQSYIAGKKRSDLDHNRMLVHAPVRCIEIVGEAASRVSQQNRAEISAVPWADVVSMRNRLIHAYFDINLDFVWDTVVDDLPPSLAAMERIVT